MGYIPLTESAEEGDGCVSSSSILYKCPYLTELCNETIYVHDCSSDCHGYPDTNRLHDICFDRKLLNAQDNPSPDYLWRDSVGIIVWFLVAGVATACGVGGGGVYVPLGILLLQFAPKPSSGLSQASIFGATLGGLLLNIRDKHPFSTKVVQTGHYERKKGTMISSVPSTDTKAFLQKDENTQYYHRPLIDYDMALLLAPMEMAGSVFGVLLQTILPNWLYLFLAALILGFTAYKTYGKFWDAWTNENYAVTTSNYKPVGTSPFPKEAEEEEHNPATKESSNNSSEVELLVIQDTIHDRANNKTNDFCTNSNDDEDMPSSNNHQSGCGLANTNDRLYEYDADRVAQCQYFLEKEARQYPGEKLFALFVLWIGTILLTFLKGGKGVTSIVGITCASPWYGIITTIQVLWTLGFACIFGYKVINETNTKMAVGYYFHPQDVIWDFAKTRLFVSFTFLAGFIAGLIGIGGGMILGPLMIHMDLSPRVSTATTATMIVLTSSSVAILFVTAGQVPWEYAVTFFLVCFFGALFGKAKIDGYVQRTGKTSFLILLLSIVIAFATLGCLIIVFTHLGAAGWCLEGFHKFCSLSEGGSSSDDMLCPVDRRLIGTVDKMTFSW